MAAIHFWCKSIREDCQSSSSRRLPSEGRGMTTLASKNSSTNDSNSSFKSSIPAVSRAFSFMRMRLVRRYSLQVSARISIRHLDFGFVQIGRSCVWLIEIGTKRRNEFWFQIQKSAHFNRTKSLRSVKWYHMKYFTSRKFFCSCHCACVENTADRLCLHFLKGENAWIFCVWWRSPCVFEITIVDLVRNSKTESNLFPIDKVNNSLSRLIPINAH